MVTPGNEELNLRPLRGPVVVNSITKCARKFIDVVFLKRYTGMCMSSVTSRISRKTHLSTLPFHCLETIFTGSDHRFWSWIN